MLYSPKHDYYFNINLELDFFNIVTSIFFRFYWAFNVSKSNITKNMKSKHLNKCIQVWSSSRQIYISCDIVQQVIIFFPQVISDLQTFSKISSFIIKTLGNTTLFLGKKFLLKLFKVKWSSEQQLKRVIDTRLKMTFGKVCWKFFSIIGKK